MKYFIDFEALQFSGEIISVGCVCENGKEFYSLVQPRQIKKLTEFITALTGITASDLENAPDAETVFSEFYNWLDTSGETTFFCYGNNDEIFVTRTLRKVKNFYAQCALSLVKANLFDYSIDISKHFGIKQSIGLKRLVEYYRNEEITQGHHALEDARFLKEVYDNTIDREPEECPFPEYKTKVKDKIAPKPIPKRKIKITAEKVNAEKKNITVTFKSVGKAADWVMANAIPPDVKITPKTKNRICNRIKKAAENNMNYCKFSWSIAEED